MRSNWPLWAGRHSVAVNCESAPTRARATDGTETTISPTPHRAVPVGARTGAATGAMTAGAVTTAGRTADAEATATAAAGRTAATAVSAASAANAVAVVGRTATAEIAEAIGAVMTAGRTAATASAEASDATTTGPRAARTGGDEPALIPSKRLVAGPMIVVPATSRCTAVHRLSLTGPDRARSRSFCRHPPDQPFQRRACRTRKIFQPRIFLCARRLSPVETTDTA